MPPRFFPILVFLLNIAGGFPIRGQEVGEKYPLDDRCRVIAPGDLGAPILASPAAWAGRLCIRTTDELVCIESAKAN